MPPSLDEAGFNEELGKRGFRIVRPGDTDFVVWGYVDVGNGVRVNRWAGGASLARQLAYLIDQSEAANAAPPPAERAARSATTIRSAKLAEAVSKSAKAPKKKGKKINVSK